MSRVAKCPSLPKGVEVPSCRRHGTRQGPKGELSLACCQTVDVEQGDRTLHVAPAPTAQGANALAGTTRAMLSNMVNGVSKGFERKLELVGVGYRAQAQGKKLNLTLGFSHPVAYAVPEGITIDTPSQTEIVIKGADKHGRPGGRGYPRLPSAGALQGQGRAVRRTRRSYRRRRRRSNRLGKLDQYCRSYEQERQQIAPRPALAGQDPRARRGRG